MATRKYEDESVFFICYAVAVANEITVDQALDARNEARFAEMKAKALTMAQAMSPEQRDAFKQDANSAWNEWTALHRINWNYGDPDPDAYIASHRANYPGDWWKPLYA